METLHSTEIGEHCRSDSATPIKRRKSNEDTTKCDIDPSEYQNDERLLNDIETAIKQNIIRTNPEYLSDDNVDIQFKH